MQEITQENMTYMSKALDLAREAFSNDEVPVGALIVQRETNTIIASSANKMREKKNATFHAEVRAFFFGNAESCLHDMFRKHKQD